MHFERLHGREPEDISAGDSGFDIVSRSKDGSLRHIAVKIQEDDSPVTLHPTELERWERCDGDFSLYIVRNIRKGIEIIVIEDLLERVGQEGLNKYLVVIEERS